MQNKITANGRVKGLQKLTRLGAAVLTVSLAATSAHAVSASKSVSVGNSVFGATASVSFDDFASGDKYRATLAARADGQVLTASLPLASGTSSLEIQRPSKCHAYGLLKLAGITKTSWDKSFNGSANFTTAPFFNRQVGGSTRVWLGPVPVTLKGSAKASIYAKGTVSVSSSPTTGLPVVRGSFGPVMDASATASGGVDMWFAGAEVTGSLKLVGVGLTGDITYTPRVTGNPCVAYRATADIQSTDGAIKVCAWIDPPFVSRSEWCKTIYEYHGGRNSYVIASGSRCL